MVDSSRCGVRGRPRLRRRRDTHRGPQLGRAMHQHLRTVAGQFVGEDVDVRVVQGQRVTASVRTAPRRLPSRTAASVSGCAVDRGDVRVPHLLQARAVPAPA